MEGDESYAGSRSFFRLESVLKDLTGYQHIIPTHQGRAAERILFSVATKRGDIVPNNTHFDTTRANLEYQGAEAVDLVIPEGLQPRTHHPFKGNIDLGRVEDLLKREAHRIPFGMMTLTNNSGGGQPVSLANLRAYRELLNRYGKPLILDVCRYAENAMFVKLREEGQQDRSVKSIAQEMFSLADGCLMSAKKDGMVNIGGFLALNLATWVEAAKTLLILTEGFPTYGGLAGRDLEALAVGMEEGLNEDYLRYRLRTAEYMGEKMKAGGVAIVRAHGRPRRLSRREGLPPASAARAVSRVEPLQRALSRGRHPRRRDRLGHVRQARRRRQEHYHSMELVRLAFPRRMYTQSHFDYAAEAICELKARAHEVRGVKMVKQAKYLRHFTAEFDKRVIRADAPLRPGRRDHALDRQRPRLDGRRAPSVGRRGRRRRQSHRARRLERGSPQAHPRLGAARRCARRHGRPRFHRRARALHRRRVRARVGAAARREDEGRVHPPDRRVREDGSARHLDHERRLGSRELGRRASVAFVDRLGDAEQPRLDQPPRRPHEPRERGRARRPPASRGTSPTSAAARSCAMPPASPPASSRTTRSGSSSARFPRRPRRCSTARSTRPCTTSPRKA